MCGYILTERLEKGRNIPQREASMSAATGTGWYIGFRTNTENKSQLMLQITEGFVVVCVAPLTSCAANLSFIY